MIIFTGRTVMATWVVGDVHGYYDEFIELINNPEIRDDDTIILIGDIIDRGPKSVEMLRWAMENISDNGRYQMVCGNHEDNIINDYDSQKSYFERWTPNGIYGDADISILNSNYRFDVYMNAAGYKQVKDVEPMIDWFRTLPLTKRVTVTTPEGSPQTYIIAHGWYGSSFSRMSILWYRDVSDYTNIFLPDYMPENGEILVHGHTPVFKIYGYPEDGVVHFREHSINVDCGSYNPEWGGRLGALRLEDRKTLYVKTGNLRKGS